MDTPRVRERASSAAAGVSNRPPDAPSPEARRIRRVRTLARTLDAALRIPGTRFRVGLDALLGLVPTAGDIAGAVLSAYIIFESWRLGAPKAGLLRMLLNVAIETVLGVVPAFGDLFDAGWRANVRNVRLLERHLEAPEDARAASRLFLVGILGTLLALLAGVLYGGFWLVRWLVAALLGG